MRKQIFKIVTLGLSLLLLTGCSTPTYIRNITVTTMDSANDGTGNIFSYDSDDLAEKTPSDMEAENPLNAPDKDYFVNKFVYTSLGEDVMPIVGYVEPLLTGSTYTVSLETSMKEFAQSGCNIMNAVNYTIADKITKSLVAEAEKNDVMMLLKWNGLSTLPTYADVEEAKLRLTNDLAEIAAYKSYAGLHVADEPGWLTWTGETATFPKAHEIFNMVHNSKLFYINLLPMYSPAWSFTNGAIGGNAAGSLDYDYYYASYVENVKPKVFIYDYYPLEGAFPGLKTQHFEQLTLSKKYADGADIPFWPFIQVSDWGGSRDATYAEIAWQVNTALCFGAKGMQYFTYNTPQGKNWSNAMIAPDGSKNSSYYSVQKVNAHIAGVDEWLLNSKLNAVVQCGITPNGEKISETLLTKSYKSLASTEGVASLVGCMEYYAGNNGYDGRTAPTGEELYYVVNDTITTGGNVTLRFTKEVRGRYSYNGKSYAFSGNSLTLNLQAGEAAAVKLDKEVA